MDGQTRAVLLGFFLSAVLTLVGWLLNRTMKGVDQSITDLKTTVKDVASTATGSFQSLSQRTTELERFRIEVEARHEYEDRKG